MRTSVRLHGPPLEPNRVLRLLHVEDSEDNATLVVRELRRAGYDLTYRRVDTRPTMEQALAEGPWDVVVADYELPHFGGLDALAMVQQHRLDVPFLIVSGAIGEEIAVRAMKAGAHDYIMKSSLARLAPAIERELREAASRRERKWLEEEQGILLEIATSISGILDLGDILNRAQRRIATLLPCDRVLTYTWDDANGLFRLEGEYGVPEGMRADVAVVEALPGELGADWMVRTHPAVVDATVTQSPLATAWFTRLECTAFVGTPLIVAGTVMGALVAVRVEAGARFNGNEAMLFENIARQITLFMSTAKMYRALQEQARMSSALARVGQELISSLDTPKLLDQLSQVTAEVLECDWSITMLWQPKVQAFVPASSYGCTPEEWTALQVLKLSRSQLADLLAHLERDHILQVSSAEPGPSVDLPMEAGVTSSLFMALRRGGEIVGVQSLGYRGRPAPVAPQLDRIASRISQLASLALGNARLVEELAGANRLKSDFMSTMSHELRTPLNIIMGYNQLLLDDTFGPLTAEQQEPIQKTQKSARDLLELINATLDMGRLETGRTPLDLADVDLPGLVREVQSDTRQLNEKPTVTLRAEVPAPSQPLHTDRVKLKVVLKNLLSNAIKFTDAGEVAVVARWHDGGVEISVADTGVGIAPDVLPIIFEPFRQGESSMTRRFGGLGLGLYVVHRLLDLLGGAIDVQSEVGHGSTFRIWIPSQHRGGR